MASLMFMFFILLSSQAIAQKISPNPSIETYIVHVSSPKGRVFAGSDDWLSWHRSFLPEANALVFSYHHVASGFAAKLSPEQVKEMAKIDGFVSARPEKRFSLHTTHSPNFLGLQQNLGVWNATNYGEGVIIGVLDTGIKPEHPSFAGGDMPPPPAKWKGKCEFKGNATCNNKLIGARNFVTGDSNPPFDDEGHGTHTSSTAAGNFISGASVFGMANGTAAGVAPRAHLAMYKVCTIIGCGESNILAGMDAAIDDGVDVLSLSLGVPSVPFYADGIAIGAFAAIQKGIFVSASAGNNGPFESSCSNEAPWLLTVGASTTDRNIVATAVLGNSAKYDGESLFQPSDFPPDRFSPLIDATSGLCITRDLVNLNVTGKVVLCLNDGIGTTVIVKGQAVKNAGGAAMILINDKVYGYGTIPDPNVIPATHVSYDAGEKIKAYINSTSAPTATIAFKGTVIGNPLAPKVAYFSSRGPSNASPGILKPDIIGPGVSILAAWPESVDRVAGEKAAFNFLSGTSMSCPHLAGVAALIKSAHPDWSPAAIKSAIMTSATQTNLAKNPIIDDFNRTADIFTVGAGHVNPLGANDPGLVYDLKPEDYISYLCGLKYSDKQVEQIVRKPVACAGMTSIPEWQLNYPSITVELGPSSTVTVTRTVTNVGEEEARYESVIDFVHSDGGALPVAITVEPAELLFNKVKETKTYEIKISRNGPTDLKYAQGAVIWRSAKRIVRTPISLKLV